MTDFATNSPILTKTIRKTFLLRIIVRGLHAEYIETHLRENKAVHLRLRGATFKYGCRMKFMENDVCMFVY